MPESFDLEDMDVESQVLYQAVTQYVAAKGGNVRTIVTVGVVQALGSLSSAFIVAVQCIGTPPEYARDQGIKGIEL